MTRATYAAGLNEFEYSASLHVSHPSIDPATITRSLGLEPSRAHKAGDAHRSDSERAYDHSHWACELPADSGDDIPTFLGRVVDLLSPHRKFLESLSDDGGTIECFIGTFVSRLCDQLYPHKLLRDLAALRIDLRLDVYPAEARHVLRDVPWPEEDDNL